MIPKPLNEITWADIVALKESGREEDDMLEYKGSFSGGPDYLAFTDSQRLKAVEGIAREAIAFLNGRGGDVIIGVKESANDHPKIEEIKPVENIDQTVDRLAQSLAAQIEPTQSIISLRAVREKGGDTDGVIVVRCQSSLRAPHRFKPNNICYIRRGRESVPMPMDEVQDVTLNRAMRRSERMEILDKLFTDIASGRVGRRQLPERRFQIRVAYVPVNDLETPLSPETLSAFNGEDPELHFNGKKTRNDVVFRSMDHDWRQRLRGRYKDYFATQQSDQGPEQFVFAEKCIFNNLAMTTDFSCCRNITGKNSVQRDYHIEWIVGYLANTLYSIGNVIKLNQSIIPGIVRIFVYQNGSFGLMVSNGYSDDRYEISEGTHKIPDFSVNKFDDIYSVFETLQEDIYSLAGVSASHIWSMRPIT